MAAATIREERPGDRDAIAAVVEAAFGSPAEARLIEAIRTTDRFVPELSLVAERDGRIVGHVMISMVDLDDDGDRTRIASLSPLAVDPPAQRRGIGSALVREVTRRADARHEPLVVLEGDPTFYGRLGFQPSVPHGISITLPSWAPPEAAQVLRLGRYDPAIRGRVVYPPAFDDVIEHPDRRSIGGSHRTTDESKASRALHSSSTATEPRRSSPMDLKLELVILPVADVDRAKAFYEKAGFNLDVDHEASDEFRIVQFTPPGSACSISFGIGITDTQPGTVKGLHLVCTDIEDARAALIGRGLDVDEIHHYEEGKKVPGVDPNHARYNSFSGFADPDGNVWVLQEVPAEPAK